MSVLHAIRWARTVPVVRRADGRPDSTAHHVLLALATFADKAGRARPSLATLADACTYTPRATNDALKRLCAVGLVKSDGEYGANGVTVWVLVLGLSRNEVDEAALEGRREQARTAHVERQRRYRDKQRVTPSDSVTRDATGERHVTPSESVTDESVTPSHDARDAMGQRHVTLWDDARDASMSVTSPGPGFRSTNEVPTEVPGRKTLSPAAKRDRASEYTPAFEKFWSRYERKGAKRKAFGEWQRALKRDASPDQILAAIPAYFASRPDARFRKDAERWLAGDCWESEHVAATPSGHQTYRNPNDQSVYDAPIA